LVFAAPTLRSAQMDDHRSCYALCAAAAEIAFANRRLMEREQINFISIFELHDRSRKQQNKSRSDRQRLCNNKEITLLWRLVLRCGV
jgi:hypothetical protein